MTVMLAVTHHIGCRHKECGISTRNLLPFTYLGMLLMPKMLSL